MKKILLASAAMMLLSSAAAYANEFNLDVNLGQPAYVEPAPAVIVNPAVPTYYDPHHRAHNWRYWHNRNHAHDHDEHWHR